MKTADELIALVQEAGGWAGLRGDGAVILVLPPARTRYTIDIEPDTSSDEDRKG